METSLGLLNVGNLTLEDCCIAARITEKPSRMLRIPKDCNGKKLLPSQSLDVEDVELPLLEGMSSRGGCLFIF